MNTADVKEYGGRCFYTTDIPLSKVPKRALRVIERHAWTTCLQAQLDNPHLMFLHPEYKVGPFNDGLQEFGWLVTAVPR